jgi:hypothetical protein
MPISIPTSLDFQKALDDIFQKAQQKNLREVTVKSGYLHRQVGGYPSNNHRMPVCCQVLRAAMQVGDEILSTPPEGNGASLAVRYRIPRG